MNTYKTNPAIYPGEPSIEFVRISKVFNHTGEVCSFNALGTTRITAANSPIGELTTVYAYAKSDRPKASDVVWSETQAENLSSIAIDRLERNGYGPLQYASGVQFYAKFLRDPYHHAVKPGWNKTFLAYNEDGETRFIHMDEAIALRKGKPLFKADWVFGLSEFIQRFDQGNFQDNSVLIITYRGEEYQTREYVLKNAIKKGFDGQALMALADFLATGKVCFAGMDDLYTGTVSLEPRELTISGLARYEWEAGRDPEIGIRIGEDVKTRVEIYLDCVDPDNLAYLRAHGRSTRYRFDENLCPIAKLR